MNISSFKSEQLGRGMRAGVIGTPLIVRRVRTTQTTRTRCPLESVREMSVAFVCLKIRSHGCPRAAVLLACSSRRSGVMLHMLTCLFANAALHLGMCLLLESPTVYDSSEMNCTAGTF